MCDLFQANYTLGYQTKWTENWHYLNNLDRSMTKVGVYEYHDDFGEN